MKKTAKRISEFQNTYTKEDLSVYPAITGRNLEALEKCGFKISKEKELKNKEQRRSSILGLCPECKQPMTYCGGNIAVCNNPECKGTPYIVTEGDKAVVKYHPVIYKTIHINSQRYLDKLF